MLGRERASPDVAQEPALAEEVGAAHDAADGPAEREARHVAAPSPRPPRPGGTPPHPRSMKRRVSGRS